MAVRQRTGNPAHLNGLDRFIRRHLKDWHVPGAAVGIVKGARAIHAKGYGLCDVERNIPVTARTLFNIASCTKAFAATSLGILVDEGRLDWDRPVRDYMPWFRMRDPVATERITARDLLTHRSGLPRHDIIKQATPFRRADLVTAVAHLEPGADFRARFQYNNLMYIVAGMLVEQVAGATWERFVQERIFDPLGMGASQFANHALYSPEQVPRGTPLRAGYVRPGKRLVPWLKTFARKIDLAAAFGRPAGPNGSIYSNAADMCRWLRMQMCGGRLARRRIISEATLRQIHSPQVTMQMDRPQWPEMPDGCYALGWVLQPYRGRRCVFHTGSGRGYNAYVGFLPDDGIGVVVMTNLAGSPFKEIVAYNAFDRLLGLNRISWHRRYKQDAARRAAEAGKKPKDRPVKGTAPSHPLDDYVGLYRHPGYGSVAIAADKGRLSMRYYEHVAALRHFHYDVFQTVRPIGDGSTETLKISFGTGADGAVATVAVPFEPAVDDIVFARAHPAHKGATRRTM